MVELLNTSPIEGHLSGEHNLSPRKLFPLFPGLIRPLVNYQPDPIWLRDTKLLPKALQRHRHNARAFAEKELRPLALKMDAAQHLPAGEINPELMQLLVKAGKQGFLSDTLPSPLGSAPVVSYTNSIAYYQAIKVEEFARVCGGTMLLLNAHNLGIAPILLSGDFSAVRRFVLPAFSDMKLGKPHLFAYAITEPSAGSDVEDGVGASLYHPRVIAKKVPGGWLLNGRKCFISGGDIAKSIVVFSALEVGGKREGMESWTPFLVQKSMKGVSVERTELKMGMRASGAAELLFEDVFVPDNHVIGGLRKGWAINRAVLNLSRIPVAAMGVGLAQGAVDAATEFVCRTKLAGKPLIHYQEIQLVIAQMNAETSAIRFMNWKQAEAYAPRQAAASMCKFHATDGAVKVCEMAMDLLGNHGVLHSNKVEKSFRDARLTQIFEGTNQINRLSVIEDMQEEFLQKISN